MVKSIVVKNKKAYNNIIYDNTKEKEDVDYYFPICLYHQIKKRILLWQGKRGKNMEELQEKLEKVKDFRPIDDVFFEVLAQNIGVCQEILRVILEDDDLIVNSVITQSSERNLCGRSVRLDALCTLGNGTKCNIEVQRSNNDNHLRRARFNASMITITDSNPGETFNEVLELYIVYISEFDFLKRGKTIYHVEKILRETGETVDDGLHEIFVNTVIDDGTVISDLMSCFLKKEVKNPKFPKLSAEVTRLKETEGGAQTVCEVMEKYENLAIKNANIQKIMRMIEKEYSKEEILDIGYTEEEFFEAEK